MCQWAIRMDRTCEIKFTVQDGIITVICLNEQFNFGIYNESLLNLFI